MGDVYDGKLWSEMQSIERPSFLEVPINLCLAINIDSMKMFPFQGGRSTWSYKFSTVRAIQVTECYSGWNDTK